MVSACLITLATTSLGGSLAGGAGVPELVAESGRAATRGADAQVATTPAPPTTPPASTPASDAATEVVSRTNAARAQHGLPPLTIDGRLVSAAAGHSRDQAANSTMSHVGSNGSTLGQRVTASGYPWRRAAENVAAGQPTASAVVAAWLGSTRHRANMLHSDVVHIGVAVAYSANGTPYWTMVLAA